MKALIVSLTTIGIIGGIVFFFMAKPILDKENSSELAEIDNQFLLSNNSFFTLELNFREIAIDKYKENVAALQTMVADSILSKSSLSKRLFIEQMIPDTIITYQVPMDTFDLSYYYLVDYKKMEVKISLDKDKLKTIIYNQKVDITGFADVLKYQDCLKIEKKVFKEYSTKGLIIFFGIFIFLVVLFWFLLSRISETREDGSTYFRLLTLEKGTSELKARTEKENYFSNKTGHDLQEEFQKLNYIEKELADLKSKNSGLYILERLVKVSAQKSKEVNNRSILMLVSGLVMAFIGVAIFLYTVPTPSPNSSASFIILQSIRPALMLLFIELIALFLLRQHVKLIEDFKYFHSLHMMRLSYLTSYKLLDDSGNLKDEKNLIIPLLLLKNNIVYNSELKEEDFLPNLDRDILKTILDKIPSPS
jgi:hypothetical protein